MPSSTSVEHMKNDMLVYKQQITLDLVVELVWDLDAAHVVWAWLGPLATHLACMDNVWYHVQDFLRYPHTVEESLHDMFRGMPPSDMKLPEGEPDGSLPCVVSEKSDDFSDIKA